MIKLFLDCEWADANADAEQLVSLGLVSEDGQAVSMVRSSLFPSSQPTSCGPSCIPCWNEAPQLCLG